ncbi:F-box/LRR-repeat protein 19-like [Sceloporus undulatus]|uniref:F-box/LRR-repeat protein 19-like n=1 Tax=Sceloporus undulatus TaxID=8520 RepID=UPI001C4C75BB|nr:F-box/LRR-repeat protein 19-like [Sceloporus undulatus]
MCLNKDSGDGTGKRRSDNGEDGVRWKLTDEPAQNKKKLTPASSLPLPPAEESQAGAHKRKKEKEPPPDMGPKKKVKRHTGKTSEEDH